MNVDNPIENVTDDVLQRAPIAREFVREILSLRRDQGIVVGVLGPWGSGKTSFINLAKEEFRASDAPVLEFNPWMFSGATDLVDRFFVEICQQLKARGRTLRKLGKLMETYLGTFPGYVGVSSNALGKLLQGADTRKRVVDALAASPTPLVVVIDDIDRLSTGEIRDIFRLVRLTGSFPNLFYVLAFDSKRVEKALEEDGMPGRAYLEKIIQWSIDLPAIPNELLRQQTLAAVQEALEGIEDVGSLDDEAWTEIFARVISPLIKNMRDVRRYALAARGTARAVGGNIQIADILGLEAVRVFLPKVFAALHEMADLLGASLEFDHNSDVRAQERREKLEQFVVTEPEREGVVRAMVSTLFPGAGAHLGGPTYGSDWYRSWLRERRVARLEVFQYYLERVTGDKLGDFALAETAWRKLPDAQAFDTYLRSLDEQRMADVIAALENFEDEFEVRHSLSGVTVLLNCLPDLPARQRGFLELDSEAIVSRVVYRLMKSIADAEVAGEIVSRAVPKVRLLSGKQKLINIVGHRESVGHGLISEDLAAKFERSWRDEVRAARTEVLCGEPELLRIVWFAKKQNEGSEPELALDLPALTLPLLRSAQTEAVHTRGYQVIREQRLHWDMLVDVFGSESALAEHIARLNHVRDGDREVVDLAMKYRDGWRPNGFSKR